VSSWEDKFKLWSKGPAKTEDERCENSINMIKSAIDASDKLKSRQVELFLQGSYRNRVNVRQDSDVDIGVLCNSVFYGDYPEGMTRETFGYTEASYTYAQFKNDVEEALVEKFGRNNVTRGNKAFDIKANSYRVEADVAPFMQHRRLNTDGGYTQGVQLFSDSGSKIINWPEQHYDNGVNKNSNCFRRYKRLVRILKKLKNEMEDNNITAANDIPGFLCECLIWNVPDNQFGNDSYTQDLKNALIHLYDKLDKTESDEWGEVCELKYLFRGQQWTKSQARGFVLATWQYVGF